MGQLALGVAGAVVGSFFGAPEIGFMLGSLAGGLLFPPKGKGAQINDLRVQQSAYGQPIPRVYGTFRVAGNMIWAGQPNETDSSGKGKGPGMPKVSMSFAMGVCKGPMQGVRRIWANGKLVYDFSDPSNFQNISGSANMLTNFTFYPGDENQLPDPTMQAALGAANVPAYRGLCYVVFNDLDLSPWGNYIPSFTFEVVQQAATSYFSQQQSSWTPEGTSAAFINMANSPDQNGATVLAYQFFISYDGLWIGQLNQYGSSYGFIWQPPNPGDSGAGMGYSDFPMLISAPKGWYDTDGVLHTGPGWSSLVFGNTAGYTYTRKNGNLYVAGAPGLGSAVQVQRLDTLTCNLDATSALSGGLTVIGATSNYLYVGYRTASSGVNNGVDNSIYQLDINTLAVVQHWLLPSPLYGGAGNYSGYCLDDDHLYMGGVGNSFWLFRPSQGTYTLQGYTAFTARSIKVIGTGLAVFTGDSSYSSTMKFGYIVMGAILGNNGVPLSSIVAAELQLAGLSSSQYDVSQLTDMVQGYAVTQHGAPREAINTLMQAYFFDVSDGDGLLKFIKRGGQPAGTIPWSDLGAVVAQGGQSNDPNPITETIVQEADLPRTLTLKYINVQTDYQEGSQRAFMDTSASNLDLAVQSAVVMSDDDAIQKAQAMLWSAWAGRFQLDFSVGLGYLQYEPGDVVYLQDSRGVLHTVRIASSEYDGRGVLKFKALGEYPSLYSNTAAGSGSIGFTPQQVGYSGQTLLAVLDVPPLRDTDTSPGLYMAACGYASDWPGCSVWQSQDGNTYAQLANITPAATIGTAQSALPNFAGGNRVDELSTVTVSLANGTLSSCTYAQLLSGVNAAWLGGEILFFRTATLLSGNTYQLSGFLRGRAGTEGFMPSHRVGEQFVLLSTAFLEQLSIPTSEIGQTEFFETFLLNQFYTQKPQRQSQVIANGRQKPFSPYLFSAAHGSASGASDISLKWIRRARVQYAWNDGSDVPLDWSSEAYTLRVYNGASLVRTAVVTGPFTAPAVPGFVYTAAMITADGFSAGNTITFTVQQNSDVGVYGDLATTTITR